jgi:hypothetical protein
VNVATVHFHRIDVGSQAIGTTDEHMISRVVADVERPGFQRRRISIDVKQTVGSTFARENIEVLTGSGTEGLDANELQRAVGDYYLDLIRGMTITPVDGGAPSVRLVRPGVGVLMEQMTLSRALSVSVPLADPKGGGW